MTFDELNTLSIEAWAQGGTIMQLMASAEENAATTIYEEHGAPESELQALTLSTLAEGLSYCSDKDAVAWYVARGIRF